MSLIKKYKERKNKKFIKKFKRTMRLNKTTLAEYTLHYKKKYYRIAILLVIAILLNINSVVVAGEYIQDYNHATEKYNQQLASAREKFEPTKKGIVGISGVNKTIVFSNMATNVLSGANKFMFVSYDTDKDIYKLSISCESNSMWPNMDCKDTVLAVGVDDPTELAEGDIVVYRKVPAIEGKSNYIVHRIVDVGFNDDGDIIYRTMGDNNAFADTQYVRFKDIEMKVIEIVYGEERNNGGKWYGNIKAKATSQS